MARAATTSDAFNAIAEPQRREILVLLRGGERPVTDLARDLGMTQPQASKHLRVLRQVGLVRETFERTGASVMGKRMFDAGEQAWPEEAPFHTPVFVVTHEKRDPWERPGGTTFHFEPALDQAREAAGDRDVRIAGGVRGHVDLTRLRLVRTSSVDP